MSAGRELQAAIAQALAGIEELTGVYDGPPARAAFPYAAIDASLESDWSHKSGTGREVMVAVTVWDDQPVRLQKLADLAEGTVLSVAVAGEWQLVTLRLIRRRTIRDVAGPWAAAIDFRARLLAA
ncbi:MAG TPA: DUF3168 domain-containing protein [Sphingomicrobium sp.]|nr:DUF3168 domain-containing protein [Sphingomicrobium sp.]